MKVKPLEIIPLVIAVLLIIGTAYAGKMYFKQPEIAPEDTAKEYYDWYLDYKGNPLFSGAYQGHKLLEESVVLMADKIVNESQGLLDIDPFLCTENNPDRVHIANPIINKRSATVTVVNFFGSEIKSHKVELSSKWGKWKISSINCPNN